MLWMLQRVVFGTKTSEANARLSDLNAREIGLMLPLLALMLFMGVYPQPFLSRSRASIEAARQTVSGPSVGSTWSWRRPRDQASGDSTTKMKQTLSTIVSAGDDPVGTLCGLPARRQRTSPPIPC